MSTSLSTINAADYIYFSSKTTDGCPGKSVKINKKLAVAFIAAVDPKSHEGKSLIMAIEQLTALAHSSDAQSNANNAAVKVKAIGSFNVCYVVTQMPGDKGTTVYITNLRSTFPTDNEASGFYKVTPDRIFTNGPLETTESTKSNGITTNKLFINGAAKDLVAAVSRGAATFQSLDFDLFYTSGKALTALGAWSLPGTGDTVDTLAKGLNAYQGQNELRVYVEGYGAHLLSSALSKVNNLSRFTFKIINPVTDVAQLIHTLDSKGAKYTKDIVSFQPGSTSNANELNASKVALGYSRLTVVNKIVSRDSGSPYAKVVMELYQNITNLPVNKLEDGINVGHALTGRDLFINYGASMNVANFVELINRVGLK
jgi:hypothetical protein